MNILGMGSLEVLAVLLVAFIFLGPDRMVEAARFLGKMAREARRLTAELPEIVFDEEGDTPERPIVHRRGGPRADGEADQDAARAEDAGGEDDSPVAFKSGQPVTSPDPEPEEKRDAE